MAEPWTPDFELRHYQNESAEQREFRHLEHLRIFEVEAFVNDFCPNPDTVIEVGCGGHGGMLSVYPGGLCRFAIDPLADKYHDLEPGRLIDLDMTWVSAFADDLPFDDETVDVCFCIEALDHCPTIANFAKSQAELVRVLRPGGLLFFMVPARSERPQGYDGHPTNPCGKFIHKQFVDLGMDVIKTDFKREGTWLLLQKPSMSPSCGPNGCGEENRVQPDDTTSEQSPDDMT